MSPGPAGVTKCSGVVHRAVVVNSWADETVFDRHYRL